MPLIFHGAAHSFQKTVRQPLQSLEVINGEHEAIWRPVGDGLQLVQVDLSHSDSKHDDSLRPQVLRGLYDVICGFSVCDDHGNLRYPPVSSAARLFGEVLRPDEFHGLARLRASCSVGERVQRGQQRRLVRVVFQQELLVHVAAVLSQADPDLVWANFQACDDSSEKPPHLLKVIDADAGGAINKEDDVGHSGFGTFWTGGEEEKKIST